MEQLKKRAAELKRQIDAAASRIKLAELQAENESLLDEINKNDWSDKQKAQAIRKRQAAVNSRLQPWRQLINDISDVTELADHDDETMTADLSEQLSKIEEKFEVQKKDLRFSGPYDDHDAILSLYAGAGGTDAQDWTQILLRMYVRWAESNGLKVKSLEQSAGDEAGLKSVTVELSGGRHIYGRLKGEQGVHRLVRLSPFNADNLRQTSFAKVEILPAIAAPDEVQIDEKDLKIDVFRAGGHGGQSVNTTDSAVRVTHLPTGITVAIQNERSQLQNRETALTILRSRLAALQLEQHAENLSELKGPSQSAEWGNQIRNYVLHPYKQVKDLRSGYETSDAEKVLDGQLSPLIEAYLEAGPQA
jgi:peptide chain release factor 2